MCTGSRRPQSQSRRRRQVDPTHPARMNMGVPGLALMYLLRPATNVGVQIRSHLGLCSFLLDIPDSSTSW
ncbi:Hypothetical protein FKW44_018368 [Caligus rogercresseyi]|uniref:Uncharacterized protein n=1 Tax=Caligus rogercresseyi TaxID=217165 RepID=A0A7T8GUF0_CALRO|nr:Hypothetical protein FKW44_018368 [Caligus rogercresseyi]